ncbi:unnamed protein product [Leptosia nina]|uniref:Uncharacterized protein n=1 Tax=Leptosia nina TaxID=320188 RepID=A0AAV1J2C9_9NEOP
MLYTCVNTLAWILFIFLRPCSGYAEFQQFPGFDATEVEATPSTNNVITTTDYTSTNIPTSSTATKAALTMEAECRYNKELYVQCVKISSKQCQRYTKDYLINLETQRSDVLALTEVTICTMSDMKADPLQLIKVLAQEKSVLDFALPGFLILISNCNAHCQRSTDNRKRKPTRHMTDQDLVIRHFLTKKNYIQLINDSKHKV